MNDLTFLSVPRLVSGLGSLQQLGQLAQGFGAYSALIVTDPGLVACGYADRAAASLKKSGFKVSLFDQVQPDPPYATVRDAVAQARTDGVDIVIGLGGGSSLDTAKIVAICANSDQPLETMVGNEQITGNRLPLIAIPTTAGTGSEVTFVSVLTGDNGSKKAIYSAKLMPDVALLDAELTLNMPRHVTAAPALDAMVHAVEAYTSRTRKNPMADAMALKALALLGENFMTVLEDGGNVTARANMLLGSTLAGMAFVNASVAAVHALSYPLGARFHIPHGHSNALVMGPVFRFNLPVAAPYYAELAAVLLPGQVFSNEDEAAEAFVAKLEGFLAVSGLETRLSKLGVTEEDIAPMATEVTQSIARLIATNPRDMSFDEVCALYRSVL